MLTNSVCSHVSYCIHGDDVGCCTSDSCCHGNLRAGWLASPTNKFMSRLYVMLQSISRGWNTSAELAARSSIFAQLLPVDLNMYFIYNISKCRVPNLAPILNMRHVIG